MTKPEAKARVTTLIKKYERVKAARDLSRYDESNTRKDFIMPLFEALGWDVYNNYSREVVEEVVIVGRVDYSFRLDNIPRFLLEAKALKVNLEKDEWAKQAVSYGYNMGIPWVVLTDFEGLKLFNSEWEVPFPRPVLELTYDQYLTKFDELWLLSKESFGSGDLSKIASKWGITAKRIPVNERLPKDLLRWRGQLFNNFRAYNPTIPEPDIDEAVQRVLDRLVFIRATEDRQAEPPTLWPALQTWIAKGRKPSNFMVELSPVFEHFDEEYNSSLFHPHLVESLETDGEPFENIINELYSDSFHKIRYNFNLIDADVLGNVYEQYLGHLLQKSRKPEGEQLKRKSQGIYYTPAHIVDFIVRHTFTPLLEEKGLRELKTIKVVDPACGSGSFLIKCFDEIYNTIKDRGGVVTKSKSEDAFLKFAILDSSIYGVDLDPQAIEIAKLNLLLMALEPHHKLPLLSKNMKVGNSLVEDRKFSNQSFVWREEFPEVFVQGGFDVVVGNPPYLSVKRGLPVKEAEYYRKHYSTAQKQFDVFEIFIERGLGLLRPGGRLGFIVPKPVLTNENMTPLRRLVLEKSELEVIADVGRPFEDAEVEGVILVLKKVDKPAKDYKVKIFKGDFIKNNVMQFAVPVAQFIKRDDLAFAISESGALAILEKITGSGERLGDFYNAVRGVEAGKKDPSIMERNRTGSWPLLRGEDVNAYDCKSSGKFILPTSDISIFKDKILYDTPSKVLVRRVDNKLTAALDDSRSYVLNTLYVLRPISGRSVDAYFVIGVLNSKAANFWFKNRFVFEDKLFPYVRASQLLQVPIPTKSLARTKVAKLVRERIKGGKILMSLTKDSDAWTKQLVKCRGLEQRIDQLVYKLYGLTPEEIAIVEGKND